MALADQVRTNAEVQQAILTGQGHVYYALAGTFVLGAALAVVSEKYWWIGVVLMLGATGVAVNLWSHGYTH